MACGSYGWRAQRAGMKFATGDCGDLAQDLVAADHVVQFVSLGAQNESRLLLDCATVKGCTAEQAIGTCGQAGQLCVGLAVVAGGHGQGTQGFGSSAGAVLCRVQVQCDGCATRGTVVGVQSAHAR